MENYAQAVLYQTQLNPDKSHVMGFNSMQSQYQYFNNNFPHQAHEINSKADPFRETIEIRQPISEIRQFDYLFLCENLGDGIHYKDIKYYYFILGFEQVTTTLTRLHLLFDSWNTYQHFIKFNDSFIERSHKDRWEIYDDNIPTKNNMDEGLDYGSIIQTDVEHLSKRPLNFIICATTPIGKLKTGGGGGGGGETPSGGDWEKGITSGNLLRFIKGEEGFAPSLYQDPGDIPTIGYGITKWDTEHYQDLVDNQPNSEEKCAKILYEALNSHQYSDPALECLKTLPENYHKQNCYDALLSLVYNGGGGAVAQDTSFVQVLKTGTPDEIRTKWISWWNNDGVLEGRRKREVEIYLDSKYSKRPIDVIGGSGTVTENGGDGWMPE